MKVHCIKYLVEHLVKRIWKEETLSVQSRPRGHQGIEKTLQYQLQVATE